MFINNHIPIFEAARGDYLISTDPAKFDFDVIYHYLSKEAYWSKGIKREIVERGANYALCFGVFAGGNGRFHQVGYARATTDFAKQAYLADVFILHAHRGHGLGKWLMQTILAHPELQTITTWQLHTMDAQGLYRQCGFHEYATPERYMVYFPKEDKKE